jgi:chromosome segregation ATPase
VAHARVAIVPYRAGRRWLITCTQQLTTLVASAAHCAPARQVGYEVYEADSKLTSREAAAIAAERARADAARAYAEAEKRLAARSAARQAAVVKHEHAGKELEKAEAKLAAAARLYEETVTAIRQADAAIAADKGAAAQLVQTMAQRDEALQAAEAAVAGARKNAQEVRAQYTRWW